MDIDLVSIATEKEISRAKMKKASNKKKDLKRGQLYLHTYISKIQ